MGIPIHPFTLATKRDHSGAHADQVPAHPTGTTSWDQRPASESWRVTATVEMPGAPALCVSSEPSRDVGTHLTWVAEQEGSAPEWIPVTAEGPASTRGTHGVEGPTSTLALDLPPEENCGSSVRGSSSEPCPSSRGIAEHQGLEEPGSS